MLFVLYPHNFKKKFPLLYDSCKRLGDEEISVMKQSINNRGCFVIVITLLISMAMFSGCETVKNPVDNGNNNVTIWKAENSPYVMDTYTVERGTKLIIEPGVTVAFKTGRKLIVKGELSAVGTEADSIIFTASPDTSVIGYKDYWCGIEFDSCDSNTRLAYCLFEKYFGVEFVILCDNSSPTFSHCVFPSFIPAVESGGRLIHCVNNSSPLIQYSKLGACDWVSASVACAEPFDFINPDSSNPRLFENDFHIGSDDYAVAGGGFLNGNYIEIANWPNPVIIDTSLGIPVDEIGDGMFTTTSKSCKNVDGITNPRVTPHFLDN